MTSLESSQKLLTYWSILYQRYGHTQCSIRSFFFSSDRLFLVLVSPNCCGNVQKTHYPSSSGVQNGVPQESILSPTFFSIFVNNLCFVLDRCIVSQYADSMSYIISKAIANVVHRLTFWYRSIGLVLNTEKREILLFRKHSTPDDRIFKTRRRDTECRKWRRNDSEMQCG